MTEWHILYTAHGFITISIGYEDIQIPLSSQARPFHSTSYYLAPSETCIRHKFYEMQFWNNNHIKALISILSELFDKDLLTGHPTSTLKAWGLGDYDLFSIIMHDPIHKKESIWIQISRGVNIIHFYAILFDLLSKFSAVLVRLIHEQLHHGPSVQSQFPFINIITIKVNKCAPTQTGVPLPSPSPSLVVLAQIGLFSGHT